jgi:HEAT repeat protein
MIRQLRPHSLVLAFALSSLVVTAGCGQNAPPPAPAPAPAVVKPADMKPAAEPAAKPAAKPAAAPAATEAAKPATPPANEASAPAPTKEPVADAVAAPTIDDLIKKLAAAADSRARVLVLDEIGAIGQNAKPALAAIVGVLADEEPRVRWHAARAIGLIGEDSLSAFPDLRKLLGDADPIVVTQAAAAIGHIREDDGRETIPDADAAVYASAVEPLAKTAVHADARARRAALHALRRLSPSPAAIAPLISRHLADADPSVVLAALHTVADLGESAVPLLVEGLKDPKSRYWAEVALAEMGPEAAAAVEPLTAVAADGEPEERLQAILALASIGEKASSAAPVLVKAIESNDATLRLAAAFALGRSRSGDADACLTKAAASDDAFFAAVASWALARIHPQDKALVDAALVRLRAGLASPDGDARSACVSGLSDLAEGLDAPAREAMAAAFMPLVSDPEPKVGTAAGAALIRLGAAAVPVLKAKLADPAIRLNVMEILSAMGAAAKPALPDLLEGLKDADAVVRGDVAIAIGAIGADAADAVPSLLALVKDTAVPAGARYAAAYALGRIGAPASEAEATLRELSASDDELMATVAAWAALKIKPGDAVVVERAIPLLRRALRGERDIARLEAAVALGDIGPAASSAVPILELVAEDDPVKSVRAAAAAALAKIKAPAAP